MASNHEVRVRLLAGAQDGKLEIYFRIPDFSSQESNPGGVGNQDGSRGGNTKTEWF